MLNKEIPFFRILLPFCAGIISGLFYKPDKIFFFTAPVIIIACFAWSLRYNRYRTNTFFGLVFTFSLYICGLALYTQEKRMLSSLDKVESKFLCTLSDFPEEKANSFKIIVELERLLLKGEQEILNGKMLLYCRKANFDLKLSPGDMLEITCTPDRISNRGNPHEFNYRFYMENHGIKYFSFIGGEDITAHRIPDRREIKHNALIVRQEIINMYREKGLKEERLALVAALTLGQKSMLEPEQKQNFIKAGVMHIMAVSGLHAVILSLFVFNILFFLRRKLNIVRILITILFLWCFAFVTGLTPSVLRATIMFSFLQAGKLMKRHVNSINSVLASAFVLMVDRPSVLYDAGFLLSYSAVLFIICFYQDLYLRIRINNRLLDRVWQSAAVTLVAQAGTLPLTIALFNRFPTYFMITNILIVPLSSLAIITGCLVLMTYPVPILSRPLASLLGFLTGATETLTEKASAMPFSTIENIGMVSFECLLLFVTIFLFFLYTLKKESIRFVIPLTALIIFILSGTVRHISNKRSAELIVYNSIDAPLTAVRTGRTLNLLNNGKPVSPDVARHCATTGLHIKENHTEGQSVMVKIGENKLLLCNNVNNSMLQKCDADIIVINRPDYKTKTQIPFVNAVKVLVINSDVFDKKQLVHKAGLQYPDTIHLLKKYGAFRYRIKYP